MAQRRDLRRTAFHYLFMWGKKKQNKKNRQINDKRRKQLKMSIFFSLLAKQEPPETLITFAVDFSKKVAKYWKKLMIC